MRSYHPLWKENHKYVGANVLLPRGNNMAQGRVCKHSRDKYGNPIGIADENPILDSRNCVAVFKDGTESELASNAIDQSINAQCDPDANTYVLFDSITDLRGSTTALCYADQTVQKAD